MCDLKLDNSNPSETKKQTLQEESKISEKDQKKKNQLEFPIQILHHFIGAQDFYPFLGIDIGGTLAKLCFSIIKNSPYLEQLKEMHVEKLQSQNSQLIPLIVIQVTCHKRFDVCFAKFNTEQIMDLLEFIKNHEMQEITHKIYITGGGAYKYNKLIKEFLNVEIVQLSEFQSVGKGMQYLDKFIPQSSFYFSANNERIVCTQQKENYPFFVVTIGSGVSLLKFTGPNQFERISGTCIGGGTFFGLCKSLTDISDFEQLLKVAFKDKEDQLDIYVKEIFTGVDSPYNELENIDDPLHLGNFIYTNGLILNPKFYKISNAELIKSILHMITFSIAQITYLEANLHKVERVYFIGNFIRNKELIMKCLYYSFEHLAKEKLQCAFVKHDGFIGALGCFLSSFEEYALVRRNTF